jgi:outer membrane protein OmpA-like peptidoglycan-associated protein
MKKSGFIFFLLFSTSLFSQNFLANPGFEDINKCEEYGAKCAPEAWFRIPPYNLTVTDKALRVPHNGKISELIVVENYYHPLARRVYLYTKILCPLLEGKDYQLSFFLNNFDRKEYLVEILFSEEELIAGEKNPLNFKPNLEFTLEQEMSLNQTSGWRKVQSIYKATGKEKFLTIGYFSKKEIIASRKERNKKGDIVMLIDDIELIPLDKNEELCPEYLTQKEKLYDQDYRHTNKISVDQSPEERNEKTWNKNFFDKPIENDSIEKTETAEVLKPVFPNRDWNEKDTLVFEVPLVAFRFDDIQIKNEFQNKLDSFALQIQYLNPEKIQYLGHTDNMGSIEYNQKLSEKRATAVQNYLNRYVFFKNTSSEVIGKGELAPKADNKTFEGRQLNRRVEIIIFKNKDNFSSQ